MKIIFIKKRVLQSNWMDFVNNNYIDSFRPYSFRKEFFNIVLKKEAVCIDY